MTWWEEKINENLLSLECNVIDNETIYTTEYDYLLKNIDFDPDFNNCQALSGTFLICYYREHYSDSFEMPHVEALYQNTSCQIPKNPFSKEKNIYIVAGKVT